MVHVEAGEASQVRPVHHLPTPTVTNESDLASRTIISHLELELQVMPAV